MLKLVQKHASEKSGQYTGSTQKILVESVNEQDEHLVTGRMSNNSVVHFAGSENLIGKIVDVELKECRGFYYIGEMV